MKRFARGDIVPACDTRSLAEHDLDAPGTPDDPDAVVAAGRSRGTAAGRPRP